MTWKLISKPKDGDLVHYVGCHAVDWRPEFGRPTVAFVEDEHIRELEQEVNKLKGELESAIDWNHSVAVCRDHTSQICVIDEADFCAICEIKKLEQENAALKKENEEMRRALKERGEG